MTPKLRKPPALKDVFICHAGVDKDFARRLGGDIEAVQWNGRKLSVFLDEWDIEIGDNIIPRLDEGLRGSRFVALLLTPEMVTSEWCTLEWTAVLHQNPSNRGNRIIPIRLRDRHLTTKERINVPWVLANLNYLDFRDAADYKRALARLLAKLRGEAPPRGTPSGPRTPASTVELVPALPERRDVPDQVPETLISNLLPVRHLPTVLWSAPTALRSKKDLPKEVSFPPCALKEGRLYTFSDLSRAHPFEAVLSSQEWERHALMDWRDRPDRWRWIVELLNTTLGRYLRQLHVGFDRETGRSFFLPRKRGESVHLKWGTGTTRCVARAPSAERPKDNWVHQAARLRFEMLGTEMYLSVEPCWMFTTDGYHPVGSKIAGPLAMQWGGKERNGSILRHVLMWSDLLANGQREALIPAGDQRIVVGRMPATVRAGVSVADDHVGSAALLKFTQMELDLDLGDDDNAVAFVEPEEEPTDEEALDDDGETDAI